MKVLAWFVGALAVLAGLYVLLNNGSVKNESLDDGMNIPVKIIPIEHATGIIEWGVEPDVTRIFFDPTGGAEAYIGLIGEEGADIVVVTDIHSDHFSTQTLEAVVGNAALIVPQAVRDQLPADLAAKATVLATGESTSVNGMTITAIPMYNLPDAANSNFHTKGRGNGYVIEKDGFRVYIAGDTAGTPEMRALREIDIALVPMNLPYTMSVDEAADAVLDFRPKQVYPYHYRGQDGLADVSEFKRLVDAGDADIEVILANWYPGN